MAQEINENIHSWLLAQAEEDYRAFTMKLLPGTEHILGVRLPVLRKLAKKLARGGWQEYLTGAADDSMEEIMLQGMTLGYVKASFEEKKPYLDVFVGKIDNWSVCDSTCSGMKPQSGEDVEAFFAYAVCLAKDRREFVARFGIVMLLDHFITDTYIDEVLQVLDEVSHDGYYVWNVEPARLKQMVEERLSSGEIISDSDRRKLTELLGSIKENDNNYIFYGRLKCR